jgi:hypothetical protein
LRSTTPTSTSTVDAIDAAITAQTNLAADFDFEGDFFSFCDHILDERDDIYVIDIRSTNASAA